MLGRRNQQDDGMVLERRARARGIRYWLERFRWRTNLDRVKVALAHDLGLPADAVSEVFDRACAQIRNLATDDPADACLVIEQATEEFERLPSMGADEAIVDLHLQGLSDRDYEILRRFKHGEKQREIAERMETDVESVRRSLVRTYSDLRMKMIGVDGGDGNTRRGAASEDERRNRFTLLIA